MTSKQQQYKQLIKMYDAKRLDSLKQQAQRQEEIYALIPLIEKIDVKMSSLGIKLAKTSLDREANTVELLSMFEEENKQLIQQKQMLLVENGYPRTYLDLHYNCDKCNDTGYIGRNPCTCFKQSLINVAYEQSNLKHVLAYENFDTFDFNYYSKEVHEIGRAHV